ncbi:MAG: type II secretion system F family protein [Victivallaceae bacterium]
MSEANTEIILSLIAAVSAGISVTCFLIILFRMVGRIQVERDQINDEIVKKLPIMIRLFMPLVPNVRIVARLPMLNNLRNQADEQLQMAGYSDAINAEDFVAVRILFIIFGLLLMALCIASGKVLFGLALVACMTIYPTVWLKKTVKTRHLEIMKALPNVLDLLTLSVEAGKDFLTSLRDILSRRKLDALGEELSRTFREIQLGKKRTVALRELASRVKQPDLTAMLNAIVQAEELGVSIANLLRIQGDMLRNKRFTRAEKLANEAPVKILFPVTVFIFPAVIIILMVPILMQAFKLLH